MNAVAKTILLVLAAALVVDQVAWAAPAPAPSGPISACTLPNGQEVLAPEATSTAQQAYYSYYYYYWYSYSYTYTYRYGRKLLQSVGAPAPSSAPRCCPTTTTKQGDTVATLISSGGLPEESRVFFYGLNPTIQNGTNDIPAGTVVTVPCYRITEYYRRNTPAPTGAPTNSVTSTGK